MRPFLLVNHNRDLTWIKLELGLEIEQKIKQIVLVEKISICNIWGLCNTTEKQLLLYFVWTQLAEDCSEKDVS